MQKASTACLGNGDLDSSYPGGRVGSSHLISFCGLGSEAGFCVGRVAHSMILTKAVGPSIFDGGSKLEEKYLAFRTWEGELGNGTHLPGEPSFPIRKYLVVMRGFDWLECFWWWYARIGRDICMYFVLLQALLMFLFSQIYTLCVLFVFSSLLVSFL